MPFRESVSSTVKSLALPPRSSGASSSVCHWANVENVNPVPDVNGPRIIASERTMRVCLRSLHDGGGDESMVVQAHVAHPC